MGRATARCARIGGDRWVADSRWVCGLLVMTAALSIFLTADLAVSLFRLCHGD